jgi:hypothetical protein
MNATPTGTNTWTVTPPTNVSVVGVAGSDLYGNPGTARARAYYLYLLLKVDPDHATYAHGQSITFDVSVLNELSSSVDSTLTLSVTGPGGYGYFDFDRINATSGISEYSFAWTVPDVAGTYGVEVSLVPMELTAYDAAWLGVV